MRLPALLMLLCFANLVIADGAAFIYRNRWDLQPESNQYALIDFENDYERLGMTIEMDTNLPGSKAVWVLPVPASPTSADIALIDGFPQVSGTSISEQARNVISGASILAAAWGTFPLSIPLALIFLLRGTISSAGMRAQADSSYYSGISIYQRVTLGGVTSDLVATNDPDELENYLQEKGIDLPWDYRNMLREYVGKDYSFVITYISDWEKFLARDQYAKTFTPLSLKVGFPTSRPYFPLRLTSLYGETTIPITIYVLGNYKPGLYREISGGVKSEYYRNGYASEYRGSYGFNVGSNAEAKAFFRPGRSLSGLQYTKIEINTQAKNFRDDLWFDGGLPASFEIKKAVADNFLAILLILMVLSSSLASIAAGRISFKNAQFEDKRFALHGLWNLTTMIGFVIATVFWNTQNLDEKLKNQLQQRSMSAFDTRKLAYVALFYFFFLLVLLALWIVLSILI